jgi:hypothetical protein
MDGEHQGRMLMKSYGVAESRYGLDSGFAKLKLLRLFNTVLRKKKQQV